MPHPIFLIGPTCVGKSTVAIGLAKNISLTLVPFDPHFGVGVPGRGDINAEIVSCDSMQVYQGMDIGTAKPAPSERRLIPHHMVDVVSLTQGYNVAQYVSDAGRVIEEIQKRNKIPLVVGGTGLYFKALVDGLFTGPSRDEEIRDRLEERIKKEGLVSLYNELKKADPASSNRIKPQDKRRIIRGLEVYYITGRPISSFQTQWENKKNAQIIGLNRDRKDLYNRIDRRVEKMFQDGFIEEVKQLIKQGLIQNKTASDALGYKEVLDYIDGRYTLDEAKELIKRNTRRFAKRQLTWFRKDDRVRWILIQQDEGVDVTVNKIKSKISSRNPLGFY